MRDMTEEPTDTEQPALPNRQVPFSEAFKEFIPQGWAPYPEELPAELPAAGPAALRRRAIAEAFAGERLVIPAGAFKVRANDTDYRFRPHSAFAWLTGLGGDREPDAVLVLEPTDTGHEATLYFKPRAPRTDPEFYADSRYGEMWVGTRESLAEMSAMTGISCAPISEFDNALGKNLDATTVRLLREADEAVTARLDALRAEASVDATAATTTDDEFAVALSEARLVKDAFELDQLRQACADTAVGFEAVVADLPEAVRRGKGERWVEGIFGLHARHLGNAIGYDTIAASGDHANTLHWIRNDGEVKDGDLLLMDAGVEVESLYTADITRTLPVSGTFTPAQRKVYAAVLAAQAAGMAAARPGNKFSDVHAAAVRVIAEHLEAWGLLPVSAEESLDPTTGGQHRRWMVHGTSHHLGLDVHDCAQARQENYRDAELRPGMVITVEPGLYFKSTDLLVPEELRGIGVRIEDDVVITDDGCAILSDHLPRDPDAIEAWMAGILTR
ncbi:MAG: aminopeptidase P family protein [Propionicimonas sp.]|uniref:aminopeptidase P family protein n=2 Tax=Propionicimonas sp. TaxID=1955623 RepID=UPI003D09956B